MNKTFFFIAIIKTFIYRFFNKKVSLSYDAIVGGDFIVGKKGFVSLGKRFRSRQYSAINVTSGDLIVGDNFFLNRGAQINCHKSITIGDNCLFGPNVLIFDHNHQYTLAEIPFNQQGFSFSPIVIGNNVWLGAGVIVLQGVNIGDNVVVAAGTLVNKSIPSDSIVYNKKEIVIRNIN